MASEAYVAKKNGGSSQNTKNVLRNANGRRVMEVPKNLSQATNNRERELEERYNYLSRTYGFNNGGNMNARNLRRINRAMRNIQRREGVFRNVAF